MKQNRSKSAPKKSGGKNTKQNNKRLGAGSIVGIVIGAVIVIILALSVAGSLLCPGILPNVHIYGIDVGGMSASEAESTLREHFEDPAEGVRISLTDKLYMDFTRADAISGYDAKAAAELAWNYGRRNGKVIPLQFAISLTGAKELFPASADGLNGEALRRSISEKAAVVNSTLVEGAYSVNGSTLTIIKGVTGVLLDEDEIYRCVRTAFEQGETEVSYAPIENAPKELSVDDIYAMVCRDAHDAEFDEEFNVIKSVDGLTFDLERARALYENAEDGAVITVTLTTIAPDATTEELSALLYRDELAAWSSTLTNNETRSTNIEQAANEVNGIVLLPGEEFSFNEVVGERTAERGFGEAAAYSGGETVYEIGGGICQVSSSIYYCALISDMDIIDRSCHLYTASYVPLGMDSTVSWGGPEFIFANSSEYPIKIETRREGNVLYCAFYGTKTDDTYIEMDYEIEETYKFETVYEEDDSVSPGRTKVKTSGITGYKIITYKSRFKGNGTLISREEVDVSVYSKRDQVVLVSPGELELFDPSAKPSPPPPASDSDLGL